MPRRMLICIFFMLLTQMVMATAGLKAVQQQVSDVVITTKINAKLAEKAKVNPFKLTVSTKDGVVVLRGAVPDKKRFVEVLRLVKSTKGVKAVEIEHVQIKSVNMPMTDAYITAKVEAAILKAKVFDDDSIPLVGINAKTVNGVVTLTGFVKKTSSIGKIVRRVYAINGVKLVVVHLKATPVTLPHELDLKKRGA